ncbi:MAG: hypothetical protein J1D88_01650 [Treponema sp.]|nr:hypothetical protein [Treponema sp.]
MPGYALRGNLPPADPAAAHRVCRSESPRKDSSAVRILHLAVHGMMERGTTPPRASAGAVLEVSHSEATGGPAAGSLSVDTPVPGGSFGVGDFSGGMNDLLGSAGRTAGVGISEGTADKYVKAWEVEGNGTGSCITVAADMVCSPVVSTPAAGGIPGPDCLRRKSGWANGVSVVPGRWETVRCTVAAAGSLSVDTQVLGESFGVGGFSGGMNDLLGSAGRTAGVGISEGTADKSVKAWEVEGNGTGPCITVAADMVCSPVVSTPAAGGIPGPAYLRRKSGWANGVSVVPGRGDAARYTVATDGSLSVDTPVTGESFGVGGFFGGMNDLSGRSGRTAGVGTSVKSVKAWGVEVNGTGPCITVVADMVCSPVASTPAAGGVPGPACLRRKSGWANGVSVVPGRGDAARCTVAADGKAARVSVMVPRGVAAGT